MALLAFPSIEMETSENDVHDDGPRPSENIIPQLLPPPAVVRSSGVQDTKSDLHN